MRQFSSDERDFRKILQRPRETRVTLSESNDVLNSPLSNLD